jgi:hypothetical protein
VVLGVKAGRFAGGAKNIAVKLSKKASAALHRSHLTTLKLIVAVAAKGADGKRVDHTYGVTVKR